MDCTVVSDSWYSLSNDKELVILSVTVDRVEGDAFRGRSMMDPVLPALPPAVEDNLLGNMVEEVFLDGSKPICFPSQQSSLATKTTSSHSPAARRRGSISLRPISSLMMSASSTPRKIFMACTLAASFCDSRMVDDTGRRDWRRDSSMAMSKEGVRSSGVSSTKGRSRRSRRSLRMSVRGEESSREASSEDMFGLVK